MLLKITEKTIRENAFEQKKKKQVKFNLGLSANWPSNNYALLSNPTGPVNSTGLLPPKLLKSQYSVEQLLGLIVFNCII